MGGGGTWTRAYPTHLVMVYLSPDHRVVLDGNLNFLETNSLHELPLCFSLRLSCFISQLHCSVQNYSPSLSLSAPRPPPQPDVSASARWFLRSPRPQRHSLWELQLTCIQSSIPPHPPTPPLQDNEQRLTLAPYACNMATPQRLQCYKPKIIQMRTRVKCVWQVGLNAARRRKALSAETLPPATDLRRGCMVKVCFINPSLEISIIENCQILTEKKANAVIVCMWGFFEGADKLHRQMVLDVMLILHTMFPKLCNRILNQLSV